VEITSDKCVKYTGIDVPVLGIKNGDSLSYVEQALIGFLTSTLDGSGIVLDIAEGDLCDLVNSFLPDCGDLTLIDLATALTKSACSLQTQVTALENTINAGEAAYDVNCLTGVTAESGTHTILQAVIDLLCSVNADLTALTLDLTTNYVAISDIDTYIADYLSTIGASTLVANKMIPYVAVEYYGSTSYFNSTGAGTGDWANIYLCNGLNGTPDKRGRVAVGVTTGMGGSTFDAAVDPAIAGNPAYILNSKAGANIVTLDVTQIPSHNHAATLVMAPHSHSISPVYTSGGSILNHLSFASNIAESVVTATGLTTSTGTVTNTATGGGLAHANNQPALACLYIIYIP
jgi:microcystin-dependent protein